MDDEQQSLPPDSSGEIVPTNQSLPSLDPIQASLYEKLRLATTPEEAQSYLNLIKQREEQIQQKEYTDFQLLQSTNQINYERKFGVYRESTTVIFSLISIILGLLTTSSIPLISPLLIILGLIKPLGYSIGEVVELYRGLTQFQQSSRNKTKKEDK
jgi:hypothetical protein